MGLCRRARWLLVEMMLSAVVRCGASRWEPAFLVAPSRCTPCRNVAKVCGTPEGTRSIVMVNAQRCSDNVDGVLFVNDACINCSACAHYAPTVFRRNDADSHHIVFRQPEVANSREVEASRAALAACPVAAIRVENSSDQKNEDVRLTKALSLNPKLNGGHGAPFPRALISDRDDVWYVGHHSRHSFGATPYVASGRDHRGKTVHVMVDTPKFSTSAKVSVLTATSGQSPDYLFLSHVDDTADHGKWVAEFSSLKRIFHDGDLGRHNWLGDLSLEQVEVLLSAGTKDEKAMAWNLEGEAVDLEQFLKSPGMGDFVAVHTPGHSPGSISLLKRASSFSTGTGGILFTGDTYAYSTRDGGGMSGLPRFGNNRRQQAQTLREVILGLLGEHWNTIAPGHGHARFYAMNERDLKANEVKEAATILDNY